MIDTIRELYKKYEDIILYLFWGGLAFFLNIFLYEGFTFLFGEEFYMLANAIAWILCVFFAYTTNRIFVFKSQVRGLKNIGAEFIKFVTCRIASGLMDMGLMFLMVSIMSINDSFSKITSQIVVIISNYIFSKLFIFKQG